MSCYINCILSPKDKTPCEGVVSVVTHYYVDDITYGGTGIKWVYGCEKHYDELEEYYQEYSYG